MQTGSVPANKLIPRPQKAAEENRGLTCAGFSLLYRPLPDPESHLRNRLTSREHEIVQLLAEGKSSKEAAVALGISVKTAETQRANIIRKLEMHSVSEVVRYAVRNQIVEA